MSTNNILLAIPARGGSKRLPFKNMAIINGNPMIYYTIKAALDSHLSPHVYVCTDNDEIAITALQCGAKIFRISTEMADDEVSSTIPCIELYKRLIEDGCNIDYIFNLQPSSPLRNAEDIALSFDKFIQEEANSLVSATEIDPHYFHWALTENGNHWEMYFGDLYLKERTQLRPVYRPNGAIKLGKAKELLRTGTVFGEKLTTYIMPEERSIHVATQNEIDFCNFYLK